MSINTKSHGNSNFFFDFHKNTFKNYVKPSLKNCDKKGYLLSKYMNFPSLENHLFIESKGLPSIFNNNSSIIDIYHNLYRKDSSTQTVSLYDVTLRDIDTNQVPLNTYLNFNSLSQKNNSKKKLETGKSSIDSLNIEEINMPAKYTLNIFGIPEKSRVETQVKLKMKLLHNFPLDTLYEPPFFWIKLPEWSITKEKLKLNNLKDLPKNIDPEKILILEPSVVCASDIKKTVLICSTCIIRERKRAIRKKRNKNSTELFDGHHTQDDISVPLEDEEKKIIVFNHPEISELKNNCINLPTRITCYCRHHKENVGFRILINIKDNKGQLIASTLSRPFMITDDHKTKAKMKIKKLNGLYSISNLLPIFLNHNNIQKRKNFTSNTRLHKKNQKNFDKLTEKSDSEINVQEFIYSLDCIGNNNTVQSLSNDISTDFSEKNIPQLANNPLIYFHKDISHENESFLENNDFVDSTSPEDLLLPVNSPESESFKLSRESLLISDEDSSLEIAQKIPFISTESNLYKLSTQDQCFNKEFNEDIDQMNLSNQTSISIPTNIPTGLSLNCDKIPIIDRLIPSEGPMHGGIEITILGTGFYSGLTCAFGDVFATSTNFWSPTVMVCILPPSSVPGPVAVKFKDYDLINFNIENTKYFTYKDDNDRSLMELALQVVGLKMTGKLENARTVAMKICGLIPNDCYESNLVPQQLNLGLYQSTSINYIQYLLSLNIYKTYHHFETMVLRYNSFLNLKQDSNAFYLLYQDMPNQTLLRYTYIQKFQRYTIKLFFQKYSLKFIKKYDYNYVNYLSDKKMNVIRRMLGNTGENKFIYNTLYGEIFNLTYPNNYTEISGFLRLYRNDIDRIIVELILAWLNLNNCLLKKRPNISLCDTINTSCDNSFDMFFLSKENNMKNNLISIMNQSNKIREYPQPQMKKITQRDELIDSYDPNDNLEMMPFFSQSQHLLDDEKDDVSKSLDSKNEKTDDGIFTIQGFSEFLATTSAKAKLASLSIPNILRNPILPQFPEFGQLYPISVFNSLIQQYPFINKKTSNSKSSNIIENDIHYNWWQLLIFGPPPPYSELSTEQEASKISSNDSRNALLPQEKPQWYSFKWHSKAFSRFFTNELTLEQQQSIREYAKIIQKIEKDKMLYLFWLPVLIIISSLIILNWVKKNVFVESYNLKII
ncbi:hypothetical protein PCANB_001740 [Pneumocystis canis]|nr:hypothetical protein PCK1_002047 [Pneumocystis canis]KAG5440171.1 hypothetical protein PCANB_001740 [Pneumocystis canis]